MEGYVLCATGIAQFLTSITILHSANISNVHAHISRRKTPTLLANNHMFHANICINYLWWCCMRTRTMMSSSKIIPCALPLWSNPLAMILCFRSHWIAVHYIDIVGTTSFVWASLTFIYFPLASTTFCNTNILLFVVYSWVSKEIEKCVFKIYIKYFFLIAKLPL